MKFIFVGGLHRSGTTLIARAFEAHPEACTLRPPRGRTIQGEGERLQTVLPHTHRMGGPGQFGFANGAHMTEQHPDATAASRARLLEEWSPFWDSNREWWVEKTPATLIRTRFLQALLPDSSFLLVMRHPLVVSLATQRWSGLPIPTLVEHWLHCHRLLFGDLAKLNRFCVLKYEAFVENPQQTYDAVSRAIGLSSGAPLRADVRQGVNSKYERMFRGPTPAPSSSLLTRARNSIAKRMARWLWLRGHAVSQLSTELPLLRRQYEAAVAAFGYSFDDFSRAEMPVIASTDRSNALTLAERILQERGAKG